MTKGNGRDEFFFLPLGGSGEIGMNLNLYGFAGKWLMVDLGVTFGEGTTAGVEVIMPDPSFIEERRDDLVGLVLTHAHEDHLGAVPYLWPRLRCPVWATGFAASLLRRKLDEVGLADQVPVTIVAPGERIKIPPFEVEPIYVTHSIPEPNALAIRTAAGTVLHTGDWKLDTDPVLGPVTDDTRLRKVGADGVLALVGDSTNAMKEGTSGSEADVERGLSELIGRYSGRIAVACFASNVGRLQTIAKAAAAHDRHVGLVGRSLWRMNEAARENGYLVDTPPFMDESEAAYVPRDRLLLICTGSQGEPRSALARIAADQHPHIVLEEGDVAIFSSRDIPGNERAIITLQNGLTQLGVEVVTAADAPADLPGPIHVSGHPNRGELAQMYQWVRPRIAIPVHGEAMHLQAHASLARGCQVPHVLVPANGMMINLAGEEGPSVVDHVPVGRLALDGERLIPLDGSVIRGRERLMWNGAVVATVVLDRKGRLVSRPQISAPGLADAEEDADMIDEIADAAAEAVAKGRSRSDDELKDDIRAAIRRTIKSRHGKRPVTDVHLVRV
jgi:ribonuclease J